MLNALPSSAGDVGLIPGWGAKILHAWQPKETKMENGKNIVTNSIKTLKKSQHMFKMSHITQTYHKTMFFCTHIFSLSFFFNQYLLFCMNLEIFIAFQIINTSHLGQFKKTASWRQGLGTVTSVILFLLSWVPRINHQNVWGCLKIWCVQPQVGWDFGNLKAREQV